MLQRLAAIFPGRLYVELQRHGLPVEAAIEPGLLALAYAHELPLVATNEAFFPTADDFEAHDALLCIAEGTYISQAEIGRAHVCTPVTNAPLVCRLLPAKKK